VGEKKTHQLVEATTSQTIRREGFSLLFNRRPWGKRGTACLEAGLGRKD